MKLVRSKKKKIQFGDLIQFTFGPFISTWQNKGAWPPNYCFSWHIVKWLNAHSIVNCDQSVKLILYMGALWAENGWWKSRFERDLWKWNRGWIERGYLVLPSWFVFVYVRVVMKESETVFESKKKWCFSGFTVVVWNSFYIEKKLPNGFKNSSLMWNLVK